jgi:hypothetical protein
MAALETIVWNRPVDLPMNVSLTPQNANRLAAGLARYLRIHYREAEAMLKNLSLRLVIDDASCRKVAFQAALLTAFNAGNRAFLGGVSLEMPEDVPLLLPVPGCHSLNEAMLSTTFTPQTTVKPSQTVYFGHTPSNPAQDSCRVDCDGWRGAVSNFDEPAAFEYGNQDDFAIGGNFAAGLAIHRCFLKATHLPARSLEHPFGMSLWKPGTDWQQPVSAKPCLYNLPTSFWLLGLGHLGQAFIWNLSMLPFPVRAEVDFLLQDFDVNEDSNVGSGLICSRAAVGIKKARHCAAWLERQGFTTAVTERKYTDNDRRGDGEPGVALCGFDRAKPRSFLGKTGFRKIIECGLGDSLADFDTIHIHTFPNPQTSPEALWGNVNDSPKQVAPEDAMLFTEGQHECGQLAVDMAGKAVSTSFVGAMAGAMVVAELLRAFNGGSQFDEQYFTPRNLKDSEFQLASAPQSIQDIVKLGFATVQP